MFAQGGGVEGRPILENLASGIPSEQVVGPHPEHVVDDSRVVVESIHPSHTSQGARDRHGSCHERDVRSLLEAPLPGIGHCALVFRSIPGCRCRTRPCP